MASALLLISAGRETVEAPIAVVSPTPTRPIPTQYPTITPTVIPTLTPTLTPTPTPTATQEPTYREVPEENLNPIEWVNPPGLLEWQLDYILRWETLIDIVIQEYDYPEEYKMLALGIIAQETQGDEKVAGCDFNDLGEACGVGVMAIVPRSWTNTAAALMNPRINISIGLWMFDIAMSNAVEKYNFRPGREATRAALAAYKCGWTSLLADNCFSFGGWLYADKILNYWIPLLETRIKELHND